MKKQNTKYKIFLDLDGTIAAFSKRIREITNGQSDDPNFPKGKLWKAVKEYDSNVQPFFETLPKMDGADELVKFITDNFENVKILTASGSTPKNAPEQKRKWAEKHYPGIPVIVVGASAQKAIYANPNSILIDDSERSIDPWRRAGGFGILFKNNNQTISELEKVLK